MNEKFIINRGLEGSEKQAVENVSNRENIKIPEIIERREFGVEIFSQLSKLSKLPQELSVENEETLQWLAATFEHPEREEKIFTRIKKYKEFVKNPEQLQLKLLSIIDQNKSLVENLPESNLYQKKYEARVLKIIKYFRPEKIHEKIVAVQADNIVGLQSGFAINLENELLIFSHSQNPDNFDHEFMHGFINPIIDKLDQILSEEQKRKIVELASEEYKNPDAYGDDWFSLLAEEIIRVYNIYIKNEETFLEKVDNKLRSLVYSLYRQYEGNLQESEEMNFENFILKKLPERI